MAGSVREGRLVLCLSLTLAGIWMLYVLTHVSRMEPTTCPETKARPAHLAVVRPFGLQDMQWLRAAVQTWGEKDVFPCEGSSTRAFVDLVFYFQSDFDLNPGLARELELVSTTRWCRRCFGGVKLWSARIADADHTLSQIGWCEMFYQMFDRPGLDRAYDYIFWMTPQAVPVRPTWLDKIYATTMDPNDFWMKGNVEVGTGTALDVIGNLHLNANAIFKIGDRQFTSLLRSIQRGYPCADDMSFDKVIHMVRTVMVSPTEARQLWPRFSYTDTILVFHSMHFNTKLLQHFPESYIVVSNWRSPSDTDLFLDNIRAQEGAADAITLQLLAPQLSRLLERWTFEMSQLIRERVASVLAGHPFCTSEGTRMAVEAVQTSIYQQSSQAQDTADSLGGDSTELRQLCSSLVEKSDSNAQQMFQVEATEELLKHVADETTGENVPDEGEKNKKKDKKKSVEDETTGENVRRGGKPQRKKDAKRIVLSEEIPVTCPLFKSDCSDSETKASVSVADSLELLLHMNQLRVECAATWAVLQVCIAHLRTHTSSRTEQPSWLLTRFGEHLLWAVKHLQDDITPLLDLLHSEHRLLAASVPDAVGVQQLSEEFSRLCSASGERKSRASRSLFRSYSECRGYCLNSVRRLFQTASDADRGAINYNTELFTALQIALDPYQSQDGSPPSIPEAGDVAKKLLRIIVQDAERAVQFAAKTLEAAQAADEEAQTFYSFGRKALKT